VKDAQYVGVVQCSRSFGFQMEAVETIRIKRVRNRQHLDCNIAFEGYVAGTINLAHATTANELDNSESARNDLA
jgi:hypothetical protein